MSEREGPVGERPIRSTEVVNLYLRALQRALQRYYQQAADRLADEEPAVSAAVEGLGAEAASHIEEVLRLVEMFGGSAGGERMVRGPGLIIMLKKHEGKSEPEGR